MLARWNDFGTFGDFERTLATFDQLRREMNQLFESDWGWPSAVAHTSWPRIQLDDTGSALVVRAEVPGLEEKDLDVKVMDNVLTLRGAREDSVPEGYSVHRKERGSYQFAQSLQLPCKVAAEGAEAVLKNGILTLTIPKSPEAQPKQISVKAG